MDLMIYGSPRPDTTNRKRLNYFLTITNMSYICVLIHNILLNMVMLKLQSIDYVSNKDRLWMYKVMVTEKANLSEVIFCYCLQAFKDRFNPEDKKNLVPYGMVFT